MEEDDEPLQLSADTLSILAEFRSEQATAQKKFEDLKAQSEEDFANNKTITMEYFGEDWNASQFWYTDETAKILANSLLEGTTAQSAIAVVSAPSVFVALKNILSAVEVDKQPKIILLEFDRRFEVFGSQFIFYDFNNPLRISQDLKGQFDRIICDPPFLAEDCQTKTAMTARFLAKSWDAESQRLVTCTGERMESTIHKLYQSAGVQTTTFPPEHKNGLSNEFRCYANFIFRDWKFQQNDKS